MHVCLLQCSWNPSQNFERDSETVLGYVVVGTGTSFLGFSDVLRDVLIDLVCLAGATDDERALS